MKSLIDIIQSVSEVWWTTVMPAAWQAGVVGGCVLAVTYLGRRWPAPLRYGLLVLALLKFAFPPLLPAPIGLFSAYGPAWGHSRPAQTGGVLAGLAPSEATPQTRAATELGRQPGAQPDTGDLVRMPGSRSTGAANRSAVAAATVGIHWKAWLLLLHFVGSAMVVVWVACQFVELRRRRRRATEAAPGPLVEVFNSVARQLDLRRPPRLLISSEVNSPMATGLWRPAVILPAPVVEQASRSEIGVILAHELAHCRRGDLWVNWLQLALLAIWWFHPVFWWVHNEMRERREDCCDDLVLAHGLTSHQAYCQVLIQTARELSGVGRGRTILALSGAGHSLAQRLRRIMDGTITRCARLSSPGVVFLVVLGGVLLPGLRSQETRPAAVSGDAGFPGVPKGEGKLGSIAEPTPAQAEAIAQLFSQLEYRAQFSKRSQVKLLEEWRRLQSSPLSFLIRQLELKSDSREVVDMRRKAAWLLGELGPAAEPALPALIRALESNPGVSIAVADALGVLGPVAKPAIPALIQALHSGIYSAAYAMTQIAPDAREVVRALLENLADPTRPQRDQTVFALQKVKIDKAMLEGILVEAAESDRDPHIRSTCAFGLYNVGANSPRAREIVAAWRKETRTSLAVNTNSATVSELTRAVCFPQSPFAKSEALMQLKKLGPAAIEAVPTLIEVLDKGEERYRCEAAMALGAMGPEAKAAVPALIRALGSDDRYTYTSAAVALGMMGPAARAALPELRKALRDTDPRLVLQAAVYLWRINAAYTADSVQGLAQLLEHLPPDIEQTGAYIAKTLGEIGPPARSAVPTLRQYLRERHEPRPVEAAQALWRIDPNECEFTLPILIEAAQDRRANRHLAVQTLGAMGPKARSALPVLQALSKDEEEPLQAAVGQSIKSITQATEL